MKGESQCYCKKLKIMWNMSYYQKIWMDITGQIILL
nr:MAG TPA: hypothetical protein [Caudoviricetes sp.]